MIFGLKYDQNKVGKCGFSSALTLPGFPIYLLLSFESIESIHYALFDLIDVESYAFPICEDLKFLLQKFLLIG